MRVVVSGSSGFIGSSVVARLRDEGHDVVRLVRRASRGRDEVQWDPAAGSIDAASLRGVDGVVHLAGEGLGDKRWSPAQKQRIADSRVRGTSLLATTIAALDPKPSVFVCGSAIGFYGLRGDEILTEASGPGGGFLAGLTVRWEASVAPAADAGIRTVLLRTGIVLARRGGAFGKLVPLLRLGIAGRLGRGDQWWSWITLEDEVGLVLHALTTPGLEGPVNATAPNPATNATVIRTAGRILRRPTVFAVPAPVLRIVMGRELTDEVILAGQRVLPVAAEKSGFTFAHPDLEPALRAVLGH